MHKNSLFVFFELFHQSLGQNLKFKLENTRKNSIFEFKVKTRTWEVFELNLNSTWLEISISSFKLAWIQPLNPESLVTTATNLIVGRKKTATRLSEGMVNTCIDFICYFLNLFAQGPDSQKFFNAIKAEKPVIHCVTHDI